MLHVHYKTVTVPWTVSSLCPAELGISNFTFHTSHNSSLIPATGMDNIAVPSTVSSSHCTFSRGADVHKPRIYVTVVNFETQLNLQNYKYLVPYWQKTIDARSFSGGKAVGAWRWPPTPSSAKVKERVYLYIYSPSRPSWPVLWWTSRLLTENNTSCYTNQRLVKFRKFSFILCIRENPKVLCVGKRCDF
jgi:hypothetical protein